MIAIDVFQIVIASRQIATNQQKNQIEKKREKMRDREQRRRRRKKTQNKTQLCRNYYLLIIVDRFDACESLACASCLNRNETHRRNHAIIHMI